MGGFWVESGLMGGFWYRALVDNKDARNVRYHDRIKTTLHYFILGEPKNLSNFGHLVVGHTHIHTSMKTAMKEASTYLGR